MDDIRSLRVSGIDPARPPRIRKEPYIDLYFQLSAQAPPLWCELFNDLAKAAKLQAKIKPEAGKFVDTWVRAVDDVPKTFAALKLTVTRTTEAYFARLKADAERATRTADKPEEEGEQGRLNRMIAALDYSD